MQLWVSRFSARQPHQGKDRELPVHMEAVPKGQEKHRMIDIRASSRLWLAQAQEQIINIHLTHVFQMQPPKEGYIAKTRNIMFCQDSWNFKDKTNALLNVHD